MEDYMKRLSAKEIEQEFAITNNIHALPSLRLSLTRTILDHETERVEVEASGETGLAAQRSMSWLLSQLPRVRGGRL